MESLNWLENWVFEGLVSGGKEFEIMLKVVPAIVIISLFVIGLIVVIVSSMLDGRANMGKWVSNKGNATKSKGKYVYPSHVSKYRNAYIIGVIFNIVVVILGLSFFFLVIAQDVSGNISEKVGLHNAYNSEVETGEVTGVEVNGINAEVTKYVLPNAEIEVTDSKMGKGDVGDEIDYVNYRTYEFNERGDYVEVDKSKMLEIRYK